MTTTVLVVDDDPPVRELLRRWLEGWGYAVKLAGNATDGLELMLAEPASIILCDIRMPGHDGLWLVERVRAKWPRTVVIMALGRGRCRDGHEEPTRGSDRLRLEAFRT